MSSEEEAQEETKRKFREALEKKKQQQSQPKGKGRASGSGPIGHTQGPASHQREFRRKSG